MNRTFKKGDRVKFCQPFTGTDYNGNTLIVGDKVTDHHGLLGVELLFVDNESTGSPMPINVVETDQWLVHIDDNDSMLITEVIRTLHGRPQLNEAKKKLISLLTHSIE